MDVDELKRMTIEALHVVDAGIMGGCYRDKPITARQLEASETLLKFAAAMDKRDGKAPQLRGEDFDRVGRVLVEIADLNRGVQLTPGQVGGPALPGPA